MVRNEHYWETFSRPRQHQHMLNDPDSQHYRQHRVDHDRPQHHLSDNHHGQVYQVEHSDTSFEDFHECRFPRFPPRISSRPIRFGIIGPSWFFLAAALISQVVILVFNIKFVNTGNTGFEPGHPNFPLFKNSRFGECLSLVSDAADCTAIMNNIMPNITLDLERQYLDQGYTPISGTRVSNNDDEIGYDWCKFASCFNGFKVVPSSYRPSIIGLTTFDLWNTLNMTAILSLWTFVRRNWVMYKQKKQHKCTARLKEIGVIEWVSLIYSLSGPIVWWWRSFDLFVADPVPNTMVSINAWATTWLLASNLHYYPYSCILHTWPNLKRVLTWILSLITVAQWLATVHVLRVGWTFILREVDISQISQGYDCLQSMLDEAPGTTYCSAEKLCSDTILLSNMQFYWGSSEQNIIHVAIAFFVILSLVAIQPVIFATWQPSIRVIGRGDSSEYNWAERFRRYDIGPIAGPALTAVFASVYTAFASAVFMVLLSVVDREAPVVVDMNCNALHVGLSTWRYYLDLSDNVGARALHIAKAWFNA